MDMVDLLGEALGLPNKDNAGALVLTQTPAPQYTSRSKHYAIKTILLLEDLVKREMKLVQIDTVEQLGDMFT